MQPAADYWTDDIEKMSKCSLLQIIELLTEKIWGRGCVILGEQKNKELIFSFKSLKIFWINKAIIEFSFPRVWRILQNSSYPTQPHSIIASNIIDFKQLDLQPKYGSIDLYHTMLKQKILPV